MIKKLLSIATASALLLANLHAERDMAITKATKSINIDSDSIQFAYVMGGDMKVIMSSIIDADLKAKGIKTGDETTVIIYPIKLSSYESIYKGIKEPTPIPAAELKRDMLANPDSDIDAAAAASLGLKGFATGATLHGVGMNSASVSGGLADAGAAGLVTMGVGLLVGGTAMWIASDDEYIMVSDVYVNSERTRVFAFISDGSIEPEEAMKELAEMTAKKISTMIKSKG